MDALKTYPERAVLFLMALVLLASSVLIIINVRKFDETFQGVRGDVTGSREVDQVDVSFVKNVLEKINSPSVWEQKGALFVSRPYLEQNSRLINPEDEGYNLHEPVPNKWFIDNELDLLDQNILNIDSDGDGFANLEEWKSETNPKDKTSHPPSYTKLRLLEFISEPFRILFAAYAGDSFQINTIDLDQPTQFLRIGDQIQGTKFAIKSFEKKEKSNPRTGSTTDISELILVNTENNEEVPLVVGVIGNSPDSFAKFKFLLDGSEFNVKRRETFTLPTEPEVEYKLVDITSTNAVIQNSASGETHTIPKLETPN